MITGNMYYRMEWRKFYESYIRIQLGRMLIPADLGTADLPPLQAYVNKGRWLIDCPECKGTEWAWDEYVVICQSCWNGYCGHKLRKVEFPANRKEIEAILVLRPLQNRNWQPGETADKLKAENLEHKELLL